MGRYLLQRLVGMGLMLLLISLLSYSMVRLLPGDPVVAMLGEGGDPTVMARVRADLGLDQPAPVYYFVWLGRAIQGDLGRSIQSNRPVTGILRDRLLPTLQLSLLAALIAASIALPLGILAAIKRGTLTDLGATAFALLGLSIPNFWLGIVFILVFSLVLGWLPPSGWRDPFREPLQSLRFMVLPALTLGMAFAASIMRQVRSGLLDTLVQDYLRTARAKGLSDRQVVLRHALRNALIPVVTVAGLMVGRLLGGAVITETIFAIPGIGRTVVDAIFSRDFPIVQGAVLMMAFIVLVVNLAVDLLYALIDPRIRYS
jgi:peptide/nickel transport system permease protein